MIANAKIPFRFASTFVDQVADEMKRDKRRVENRKMKMKMERNKLLKLSCNAKKTKWMLKQIELFDNNKLFWYKCYIWDDWRGNSKIRRKMVYVHGINRTETGIRMHIGNAVFSIFSVCCCWFWHFFFIQFSVLEMTMTEGAVHIQHVKR